MSGERKTRTHDRAFKLAVLARVAAGETVSALSREVGVRGKLIYRNRPMTTRGQAALAVAGC